MHLSALFTWACSIRSGAYSVYCTSILPSEIRKLSDMMTSSSSLTCCLISWAQCFQNILPWTIKHAVRSLHLKNSWWRIIKTVGQSRATQSALKLFWHSKMKGWPQIYVSIYYLWNAKKSYISVFFDWIHVLLFNT